MKNVRRIVFWLHLATGVSAGAVVLIMSVTGVLLTYEKQMLRWADHAHLPAAASRGRRRTAADRSAGPGRQRRQRRGGRDDGHGMGRSVGARRRRDRDAPGVRQPVHRRRPRRGFREAACVFQARDRLASLPGRGCRPGPRHRARDHGRLQPGVSLPGRERLLLVDAEDLDVAADSKHRVVQGGPPREGARLQLAQRHRLLVRGAARHRRLQRRRHFVSVGEQPRLPDRG